VGDVEVTAIRDKAHDFNRSWHYPDVPEEAWEPYRDLVEGPDAYVVVNFGCFLVRGDGRVVLIDTGWGPELGPPGAPKSRGALLHELDGLGIGVDDVDTVAFTHLHADHVGWNLVTTADGLVPRFTKARYLVPELDWQYFSARKELHPNIRQQAIPLGDLDVTHLFTDGHPLTPSVVAEATPGHTPGHTSFVVSSGGEQLFILGDLAHHPVVLNEPEWVHRFDVDPATAVDTRKKVLERLEQEATLIGAGHFRHPSFGMVRRVGGRRVWRALDLAASAR
jgi:glyoxylase-like metal-dependent hydrolase (beta-lactamase superfamily II)